MLQCRPSARLLKEAPRPGPLVQFGKQQAHLHRAGTNRIKGRNVEGYKGCLPTHRPHVAGLALDLTKPQRREKPLQFHVRRAIFIGFKKPTDFPVGPHVPTYHDSHDTDAMLQSRQGPMRSEEHTSELKSLMRISNAVFCLKKKKQHNSTKSTKKTTTQ